MWGGMYNPELPFNKYVVDAKKNQYNNDQEFLRDKIYPLIENEALAHDSWSCTKVFRSFSSHFFIMLLMTNCCCCGFFSMRTAFPSL